MRRSLSLTILLGLLSGSIHAQALMGKELFDKEVVEKTGGIEDRTAGIHNASNIGMFFENRGKLYPRRLSQGPSGEFPINSGKHYIYRCNPFVGVPGNVVQGRFTSNEEWEAVGGYHNPDLVKVAFSDNSATWNPDLGWPVKDSIGNPIIKSDQDGYCVFNDATNSVEILGLEVAQTSYAYGVKFAQNIVFFKYEITNKGTKDLDSLFFGMYVDLDVGDAAGGDPEYNDDRIGFDRENDFLYFHDDGLSSEWPGGTTGYFGFTLLRTPKVSGVELGATSMHYNIWNNDRDEDDIQFAILSSNLTYIDPQDQDDFFHPGAAGDFHFDDPATIPASGLDLVGYLSSGPYQLDLDDTLTFYTAFVAGESFDEATESMIVAKQALAFGFDIAKPPSTPSLSAIPGDGRVTLFWDDPAESSRDNFTGEFDFEGYRIYRSVDKGGHWDQIDRNANPTVGPDPIPIADFDVINEVGLDRGLQHSFTDTTVINGIEYWYTVTAYDRGDESVESLESPKGSSPDAINTEAVVPRFEAIGRTPVTAGTVQHVGVGRSNYLLEVNPVDDETLAGMSYTVGFTYTQRTDRGDLDTRVSAVVNDSAGTQPHRYGVVFTSPTSFDLINLTTGAVIREANFYRSGTAYRLDTPGDAMRILIQDPNPSAPPEILPEAGDFLSLNFAAVAIRNGTDTVIAGREILFEREQATTDGILMTLGPPEIIQRAERLSGTEDITIIFTVTDETAVDSMSYAISIEGNGFDDQGQGFVSLVVRNSADSVIAFDDTLSSSGAIDFAGVEAVVTFPSDNPPGAGNAFVLETIIPIRPNLLDAYQFAIQGSQVNSSQVASGLNTIRVVPNPYLASSLYEVDFGELRNEPLRQIQFINLPGECTIHIFSVAGDLIKTIRHNAPSGSFMWDMRTEGGREIATGIYIYVVRTPSGGEYMSRFAVIK